MGRKLDDLLKSVEPKILKYRRDFHKYAEPGWGEYRTASIIAERLEELGFTLKLGREVIDEKSRMGLPSEEMRELQYRRALSEGAIEKHAEKMMGGFTGVVGELANGDGPTIGFRFDIDAVEMEEKGTEGHLPRRQGFESVHKEAMHSCGHDGHASIGLGLAETLAGMRERLGGRIKLIFQPAEEGARGAKAMVEAGVVDDVDYLFGLHIGSKARSTGEFCCGTGGFLATSKMDAYFHGTATHAGFDPQEGKNALLAAANAAINLYAISRHGGGGTRINVGKMTAGTGRNVIPAEAHLLIETRGENSELDTYMKTQAETIIKGAAEMYGNGFDIVPMGEAASAESDEDLVRRVYALAGKHALFPKLREREGNFGGSEDFTLMMRRAAERGGKASYFLLGSRLPGNHHSTAFDFDESILINGVKILSLIALDLTQK